MDIKTKIQLEEKNFQHYIDLGVYDSEDIAGLEVWQIIDRIRKRDCVYNYFLCRSYIYNWRISLSFN